MSLRQAVMPCRGTWMTRIQPSQSTSFSTSAASHGRREVHRPHKEVHRLHKEVHRHNPSRSNGIRDDVAPIKRRAKKADFVDSVPPSSTNGSTKAANTTASDTASRSRSAQPPTPIITRIKQHLRDGSKDPRQTKEKANTVHEGQSRSSEPKQRFKSSRLSFEDLMPRQHRQNYWLRQRLLHHQRKQMHQNHHHPGPQHGQHPGQHHGQQHGQHHGPKTDPNFWWMWHMMESRKTIFRSFASGVILTGIAYKIYSSRDAIKTKQNWLQLAQEMVHARMSLLESEEPSAPGFTPLQNFSTASPAGFPPTNPALFKKFTGTDGMFPLSLASSIGDADPEKKLKMLTPESVELKLAEHQRSFVLQNQDWQARHGRPRKNLVKGYSVNQLASNSPIEDDLSAHVIRNLDGDVEQLFFGIFDGHSGWCCSQKVAHELAPSVAKELKRVRSPRDTKSVSEAIERGFLHLDKRIVEDSVARVLDHGNRPLACSALLPAISGSCAIMAYVNERERDLYVACLGDCRAVMGVREPLPSGGHVWRAVPLSSDQTGRSKSEIKRLQLEHPGEEDTVVRRGRVLGRLEPTRTFGDARYKWSKEIQDRVFSLFPSYREPSQRLKTPPYVTAKPVVRHHKIQSEDRFMVMATDGLWDKLTSDEVVQLVGGLLDGKTGQEEMVLDREEIQRYRQQRRAIQAASQSKSVYGVDDDEEEITPANLAPKGPSSQLRKFTYRDQANVATHLIRNAIGGADDDKVAATMSIPSPMSRIYRDDITVAVIFFEQQETTLALSNVQPSSEGLVEIH